jgi:ubiquinone/menaquinone biosynthesis C-methylase UbiE
LTTVMTDPDVAYELAAAGFAPAASEGASRDGPPAGPTRSAYTREAESYEQRTSAFHEWRQQLVEMLPLERGDVVLDVGCGTGLCLPLLQSRVGPEGLVVGIDGSAEMLAVARRRVLEDGSSNVVLVESAIETVDLPVTADAALFSAVHDICQSPTALRNVFRQLRPGAWVVAGGGKWAPPWMVGLNMLVYALHAPYVSSFTGFDRPWRGLEELLAGMETKDVAGGAGYVARGRTSDPAR